MLIMLTPSLACAMPICADSKKKTTQNEHTPCAEHHSSPETDKSSNKVDLLIDCMGVDLQTADSHADLKQPDFKSDVIVYATADDIFLSPPDYIGSKIRGPPPDWLARSQTHPPLILTTHRFRI